jgi:hypothetical protein
MPLARTLGDDVTGTVLLDHPRRPRLRMPGLQCGPGRIDARAGRPSNRLQRRDHAVGNAVMTAF